jgi:hypothetical protein
MQLLATNLWWSAVESKRIGKLSMAKQLTICFRQFCFVADASPMRPNGLNLMLDDVLGCFHIEQD